MSEEFADLYQAIVMDRGRRPRHGVRLADFDATAKGDNPMCGDRVQVWVRRADGGIDAVGFEARGCAISIASADLMVEAVQGRSAGEARALFSAFGTMARTGVCPECAPGLMGAMGALAPLSGVHEYSSRVKCATLPWHALMAALDGTKEASSE
jgi:nitrogen fixation NifU-like protein